MDKDEITMGIILPSNNQEEDRSRKGSITHNGAIEFYIKLILIIILIQWSNIINVIKRLDFRYVYINVEQGEWKKFSDLEFLLKCESIFIVD
ncbi:hypothetical protein RhiirC2_776680 [Rhizophagus irregularis]|uniref:Uncharacterized protein n=1 Tax=Rhizophagus irregularis TaxID=588596 RepID=A0A2N1NG71_9GLOM|nr:hypothetical protein RhiirC2_776680 [Rhizophagus irregularis]